MNQAQFLENISRIHELFRENELHLNTLSDGIGTDGSARVILDNFLDILGLEKNSETRYVSSARVGGKKFEPLDIYLEKIGKTRQERDDIFEKSYGFVRNYYEALQEKMLGRIEEEKLLPAFYMTIFRYTHTLGKLYSTLFLRWNRKLLFEQNRNLEARFENNQDAIIFYLQENALFDTGHHGDMADRSYSLLEKAGNECISRAYSEIFPEEVKNICEMYEDFIQALESVEDETYQRKKEYITYFQAIQQAWKETDVNELVNKWSEVDIAWMAIDTPVQPGHPIEYYEDKYRRAVSIEFDLRLSDPSLFESTVAKNIEHMYEAMYDEIGRENFPESYQYSLNNQKKVQLYIGAPVLQYGSFLCGSYSAQVVPNDDQVSKVYGKKIFAFPKFVLESQKTAPKMALDIKIIDKDILEKYYAFLNGPEERYYEIYDIETIGHEFGHTLWLTPGIEVRMGEQGLYKNIEEFKATAGGLVAYFISGGDELLDEDIIITSLMRDIRMMRYREVEDILPYYCECLIHLHIFFMSGMIDYHFGKIRLHYNEKTFTGFKELYTSIYTQQIFTYLKQMEAGNFLFEFVVRENGIFLPKEEKVRKFVEDYFEKYKEIGNEVA